MSTGSEPRPRPYKFVQRMRDRYGVWRHYLRRPGFKRVPLAGLYGSEQFAESYRLAMGGSIAVAPREIGANRAKAGSLDALVACYFKSDSWMRLAKNSKHTRKPILERLRSGAWGSVMVRDLAQKHVSAMLDKTGHGKRHQLNAVRGLLAYAVETELIENDPSAGIKVVQPKSDGYHTWTDDQIERYRAHWPLGSEARLVLEFALETASRRCEVVRLGRQHVWNGRIQIARAKGCNDVDIPVTPELQAAIAAMPDNGNLTFLVRPGGKPYTPDMLGRKFKDWANAAGLPQQCRLHGLRKGRARQIADSGGTAHDIMSITGHKTLREAQRYADKYNRRIASDRATALLMKRGQKANAECKTA